MPVEPLVLSLEEGKRIATLTPAEKDFPERVTIVIQTTNGDATRPPYVESGLKIGSGAARAQFAQRAQINEQSLSAHLLVIDKWIDDAVATLAKEADEEKQKRAEQREFARKGGRQFVPFALTARTITQTAAAGTVYRIASTNDVMSLFQRPGFEPDTKFEWPKSSLSDLSVLDLDFHALTGQKPTDNELDELGDSLSPVPYLWWKTQGGGLHATYLALPHAPYTAEELAVGAAAALYVNPIVVRCGGTLEILASSRHPLSLQKGKACGPLRFPGAGPDDVFTCLQRFSVAGATDEEIGDVMDELGYVFGQRLDHSHCLIDPGHASKSPNPVLVGEHGLFCYSCAGRDGNGFMSWNFVRQKNGMSISQNDEGTPIRRAVEQLVHFNHFNYLIGALAPEIHPRFRRPLYSALLKRAHLNSPLIQRAFTDFSYVRGKTEWLHADSLLPVGRDLNTTDVSVLASTVEVVEAQDGPEIHPKINALSVHTNNGNIPGWTPIQPMRHVPLFSKFNIPSALRGSVLCRAHLPPDGVAYLARDKRIPMEEAEKWIDHIFPGISFTYMKALMVAGGCAEAGEGPVPILWATGQTGAAKTSTLKLVLGMLGEPYQQISSAPDDRMDQMFGESITLSRFVAFDDFAKKPEDFIRFQAFFTRLSREGFSYHKLHHGLRTIPVNSALILTDWKLPVSYTNQPQFARRAHLIRLQKLAKSWENEDDPVSLAQWWRRTEEIKLAAESFYSWFVDDFFPEGDKGNFSAKMKRLGVLRLTEESGEISEHRDLYREHVYDLVLGICQAQKNESTWKRVGRGFVDVPWKMEGVVGKACTALVESLGQEDYTEDALNHALEQYKIELHTMFQLNRAATFSIRSVAKKVYIRLTQEGKDKDRQQPLVNVELMKEWPLPAGHKERTLTDMARVEPQVVDPVAPAASKPVARIPERAVFNLPDLLGLTTTPAVVMNPLNKFFTFTEAP